MFKSNQNIGVGKDEPNSLELNLKLIEMTS